MRVYPSVNRPDLDDLAPAGGFAEPVRCTLPSMVDRREAEAKPPPRSRPATVVRDTLNSIALLASQVLIALQYTVEPGLYCIALLLQPKVRA